MPNTKTAISVEDELFQKADQIAAALEISRSALYARALQEFVRRYENQELLRELNVVYADEPTQEDLAFLEQGRRHLGRLLDDNGS